MKSPARALVVGAAGIVCVVLIVSWAELVTGRIMIGFLQLPPVVLPLLFLLVVLNRVVARRAPRLALSAPEIAVAYLMMVLAAMITSRGVMEDLIPVLVGVNYYGYSQYFPYIRPWLVPWDPRGGAKQEVARAFYEGYFYGQPIPWAQWVIPLFAWLLLIAAVFGAFLCLAALFRRPWVEQERLSFPLVQLPLEMIREGAEGILFRNRLLWAGFALPAAVFTLNGLHQFYPTLPEVPTEIPINPLLSGRPWSDMSMVTLFGSFAGVGFFFLLPVDLLFSFWFFFLLGRGEEVFASMLGAEPAGAPHAGARELVAYQTAGAFVVLAGYLLYVSRRQWQRAWSGVRGGHAEAPPLTSDAQRLTPEMLPPRTALLGLIGCGVFIIAWLWAAGMSPPVALLEMGGYLLIQGLVMGRAMAEGGMLMSEGSFTPMDLYGAFAPRAGLGAQNLTTLAFTQAMFTRDLRGMPFSGFLDGQKLGEGVGLNLRLLVPVFAVTFLLTLALAIPLHLWLPYRRGAVTLYSYTYRSNATQFWREHASLLHNDLGYRPQAAGWLLLGGGVCALLALLRMRFYWWPLHPLGYAMSASWTVIVFWFPMLVAWLLKLLTIRYGGMRLYAAVRPFFLGMIFGEFTLATIWTLISILWDTPVPTFPWP